MNAKLNPTLAPTADVSLENSCGVYALSAVTGLPMSDVVARCRTLDSRVASGTSRRGYGTPVPVMEKVLESLGYATERVYAPFKGRVELGTFLARFVKHRTAIVVVRTGRSTHAIAASGLLVSDNGRLLWHADAGWGWRRSRAKGDGRPQYERKPYSVICATIIQERRAT